MSKDTDKSFPFTVEGEPFNWNEEKVTARKIIAFAQDKGILTAPDDIEKFTLKGSTENIYSGDDWIDLLQDHEFTLGVKEENEEKLYRFKVNGQELESSLEKLVALDIIKLAQEKGVPVPDKPENFLLEAIGGGPKFKSDEWVDLSQFNEFILILNAPTIVA